MNTKSDTYQSLYVSDISCASCVNTIENTVMSVPGVKSVEVNFADKTVNVTGDVAEDVLIKAISGSGYTACSIDSTSETENKENQELAHYRELLKKTAVAGVISVIILAVTMLDLIPDLSTFRGQLWWGIVSLLSLFVLVYAGGRFFTGALKSFRNHNANMDTLVALGTGVAWLYSTFVVVFPG